MKQLLLSFLTLAIFSSVNGQSSKSDCINFCKVSRIIEEGVFLGVQITNKFEGEKNAHILQVFPKTAAEKSGLKVGDIILKIDKTQIEGKGHLVDVIQTYKAGDRVLVTYQTGDEVKKMKVRLGAKTTRVVEETECCDNQAPKARENVATEAGLIVFPNPASKFIQLQTKEALEGDVHILIYTMDGKEVYYDNKKMDESLNEQVDVSEFTNGQFFVRLETEKMNYIQKFEIVK